MIDLTTYKIKALNYILGVPIEEGHEIPFDRKSVQITRSDVLEKKVSESILERRLIEENRKSGKLPRRDISYETTIPAQGTMQGVNGIKKPMLIEGKIIVFYGDYASYQKKIDEARGKLVNRSSDVIETEFAHIYREFVENNLCAEYLDEKTRRMVEEHFIPTEKAKEIVRSEREREKVKQYEVDWKEKAKNAIIIEVSEQSSGPTYYWKFVKNNSEPSFQVYSVGDGDRIYSTPMRLTDLWEQEKPDKYPQSDTEKIADMIRHISESKEHKGKAAIVLYRDNKDGKKAHEVAEQLKVKTAHPILDKKTIDTLANEVDGRVSSSLNMKKFFKGAAIAAGLGLAAFGGYEYRASKEAAVPAVREQHSPQRAETHEPTPSVKRDSQNKKTESVKKESAQTNTQKKQSKKKRTGRATERR